MTSSSNLLQFHIVFLLNIFVIILIIISLLDLEIFKKTAIKHGWLNYSNNNFTLSHNIYFIETSRIRKELSLKQLCAIESAAYNNVNDLIFVYSLNANIIYNEFLKMYPNIRFVKYSIEDVFNGTPFSDWFKKNKSKVLESEYSIAHLSDALRITLLWKYGGFYLDLDTITIKNFDDLRHLPGLGAIIESNSIFVGNGVLNFPKKSLLLYQAMIEFISTYDPECWGCNGPTLFDRQIKQFCNLDNIYKTLIVDNTKQTNNSCNNHVNIYPINYFYPISWEHADELFKINTTIQLNFKFNQTYAIHFFGKLTSGIEVRYGEKSVYEHYASKNCPYTYNIVKSSKSSFSN